LYSNKKEEQQKAGKAFKISYFDYNWDLNGKFKE
jgi:hypothetical protein